MTFLKLKLKTIATLSALALFSAQASADNYSSFLRSPQLKNIADDVVEVRVDNGVHWISHNTDWTEKHASGRISEWKETRRHANVIYLEHPDGRKYGMTRLDFNDKTVKHCTVMCIHGTTTCQPEEESKCKTTGDISTWYNINKFRVDARDIKGVKEGDNGENWQSDGNKQWFEFSDNGLFYWEETHRDINSIYLKDKNGRSQYTARIDLFIAKIMLCEEGKECGSLGHITKVW